MARVKYNKKKSNKKMVLIDVLDTHKKRRGAARTPPNTLCMRLVHTSFLELGKFSYANKVCVNVCSKHTHTHAQIQGETAGNQQDLSQNRKKREKKRGVLKLY